MTPWLHWAAGERNVPRTPQAARAVSARAERLGQRQRDAKALGGAPAGAHDLDCDDDFDYDDGAAAQDAPIEKKNLHELPSLQEALAAVDWLLSKHKVRCWLSTLELVVTFE